MNVVAFMTVHSIVNLESNQPRFPKTTSKNDDRSTTTRQQRLALSATRLHREASPRPKGMSAATGWMLSTLVMKLPQTRTSSRPNPAKRSKSPRPETKPPYRSEPYIEAVHSLTRQRSDFYSIFSATIDNDSDCNRARVEPWRPYKWIMAVTEEDRGMARLKKKMDEAVDDEEQAVTALLLAMN
ncbi:hypothetical protein PM082_000507 [Marasmius tenuissimus]|nr:hypothetical protein PM082_000507 [Marasmius tenuissimus]